MKLFTMAVLMATLSAAGAAPVPAGAKDADPLPVGGAWTGKLTQRGGGPTGFDCEFKITKRDGDTPSSIAASMPSIGTPTAASHEPVVTARAVRASASDIPAGPTHPIVRPRSNPASGNIEANTSSTGKHRSRAVITGVNTDFI